MATQKIYDVIETPIIFQDSGGDAAIALINLTATTGGIYSDRFDRGAGAKPSRARVWGTFQFETTMALGETVLVFVVNWSSHATPRCPGGLSSTGASLSADQARNLNSGVPSLIVTTDKTTAATDVIGSAIIDIPGRYVTVAVRNLVADNLENTANANQVYIEFISPDIQAPS